MTPVKDKNLSSKNLKVFHKHISDSEIYAGSSNEHTIFSDRDVLINTSKIILKEESKLKHSFKSINNIPSEIWMG